MKLTSCPVPSATHPRRFYFLALRVGLMNLLRRIFNGLVLVLCWCLHSLDYARNFRGAAA